MYLLKSYRTNLRQKDWSTGPELQSSCRNINGTLEGAELAATLSSLRALLIHYFKEELNQGLNIEDDPIAYSQYRALQVARSMSTAIDVQKAYSNTNREQLLE